MRSSQRFEETCNQQELVPRKSIHGVLLDLDPWKSSLRTSNTQGAPCSTKSKISTGLTSSPAINILNFSSRCGSGVKGARPRVRHNTISNDKGIVLINFRIGLEYPKKDPRIRGLNLVSAPRIEPVSYRLQVGRVLPTWASIKRNYCSFFGFYVVGDSATTFNVSPRYGGDHATVSNH
jgi:hypothetical protein